jgi:hypothetical protein
MERETMGGRKRTQRDTPDGGLTPQQCTAVDLLTTGKTLTESAAAIGVGRPAVSAWVNHYPPFIAALNSRRQELWESQVETLRGLLPRALQVLQEKLEGAARLQSAVHILKAAGLYGVLQAPTGPTTLEEAEYAKRRREQDRLFMELGAL